MSRWWIWLLALGVWAGDLSLVVEARLLGSTPSGEESISPGTFARRMLGVIQIILDKHVDPPTRQEMVLAAARGLARKVGQPLPARLSHRISSLDSEAEMGQLLEELWAEARSTRKVDDDVLQLAALNAIALIVPGPAAVLSSAEARVQQQLAANRYVGIGVQLAGDDAGQRVSIVAAFPRGAARKAGARPGDVILEIDGVQTGGMKLDEVVRLLRGEAGTPVSIMVRQPGAEIRKLEMVRAEIPIESVHGYRRLGDDTWKFHVDPSQPIAYLRLNSVTASTLHELREAARAFEAMEIRGLILDLRNDSGSATLEHFLLLADELLDVGLIGRTRDGDGNTREFAARPDCLFKRLEMAVLVNEYTRGDPEFLAAALQDAGRASVVGMPTAGDAAIRREFELPDGLGYITLQVATWERPSGRALARPGDGPWTLEPPQAHSSEPLSDQPWGVHPDTLVKMPEDQAKQWAPLRHKFTNPSSDPPPDFPDSQLDEAMRQIREQLSRERYSR